MREILDLCKVPGFILLEIMVVEELRGREIITEWASASMDLCRVHSKGIFFPTSPRIFLPNSYDPIACWCRAAESCQSPAKKKNSLNKALLYLKKKICHAAATRGTASFLAIFGESRSLEISAPTRFALR